MVDEVLARYPYWMTAALMVIGLYGMMGKRDLVKKLIGMNIFQTGVILFFISGSTKAGATVPIIAGAHGNGVGAELYVNPLPHVLMLTAIVVSAAITGVALAFLVAIYRRYGSLDERTILEEMQ